MTEANQIPIFIHELKFKGDDPWTNQFNKCSDLWQKSNDPALTEEQRHEAFNEWFSERQRLELGMY